MAPIINPSQDPRDALDGAGKCGGVAGPAGGYPDRCGYGPRLPLLVISPYAKPNFVDHTLTDQTSILRFIEDNWKLGRIGDHSFDARAGSLKHLFNFKQRRTIQLLLKSNGAVKKVKGEYRLSHLFAGIVLVDRLGRILLQERDEFPAIDPEKWGLVGGHVDDGEDVEVAAYRELLEETGVRLSPGTLQPWRTIQVFHAAYGSDDRMHVYAARRRSPTRTSSAAKDGRSCSWTRRAPAPWT